MTIPHPHDVEQQLPEALPLTASNNSVDTNQPTGTRLRIRIPKKYSDEPIISRLISDYGVISNPVDCTQMQSRQNEYFSHFYCGCLTGFDITVNIAAALLGANARDDGWFDLELRGNPDQIKEAVSYLNDMEVEIWRGNTEEDTW